MPDEAAVFEPDGFAGLAVDGDVEIGEGDDSGGRGKTMRHSGLDVETRASAVAGLVDGEAGGAGKAGGTAVTWAENLAS